MSWFFKNKPIVVAPIMVPRGKVMLALAEECVALKIDVMPMTILMRGVVRHLAGEAAGQEMIDRVTGRDWPRPSTSSARATC